jgi:hypothetical protein
MTAKLRLGPIPKVETVKLTVKLSVQLKANLDRYAELHAQVWGEYVDAATLIPHIIETFIERDRSFRKVVRSDARASEPLR